MTLGENIKRIRLEKHLKQSDLAALSKISRVAIGNYERGSRQPNVEIINKLAVALNVTINDLIGIKLDKERIENIEKFKNEMSNLGKMLELNKKKDAGTATNEDVNILNGFNNNDWLNFGAFGLSDISLPLDAISYILFLKFIESLGYKSEDLKINKLDLFNKVKYQIDLEINFINEI